MTLPYSPLYSQREWGGAGGGVGFEILWVFRYDAATSLKVRLDVLGGFPIHLNSHSTIFFKTVAAATDAYGCPLSIFADLALEVSSVNMRPEPALALVPALALPTVACVDMLPDVTFNLPPPPQALANSRKRKTTTEPSKPPKPPKLPKLPKLPRLLTPPWPPRSPEYKQVWAALLAAREDLCIMRTKTVSELDEEKRRNEVLRAANEVLTGQLVGMTTQLQGAEAQMNDLRVCLASLTAQISGMLGPDQPTAAQLAVAQQPVAQPPAAPAEGVVYPCLPGYAGPMVSALPPQVQGP